MTEAIYYTVLGILAALIAPFLWYALKTNSRESRLRSSEAEKSNRISALEKQMSNLQSQYRAVSQENYEQQEKIAEYTAKVSILSNYTFDPLMGYCKAGTEGKIYCTACLLKFKESPLGIKDNPLICPVCKIDYSRPPIRWAIHREPPDNPFRGI